MGCYCRVYYLFGLYNAHVYVLGFSLFSPCQGQNAASSPLS